MVLSGNKRTVSTITVVLSGGKKIVFTTGMLLFGDKETVFMVTVVLSDNKSIIFSATLLLQQAERKNCQISLLALKKRNIVSLELYIFNAATKVGNILPFPIFSIQIFS